MRYVLATIALSFLHLTPVGAAEQERSNFLIVIGDDVRINGQLIEGTSTVLPRLGGETTEPVNK